MKRFSKKNKAPTYIIYIWTRGQDTAYSKRGTLEELKELGQAIIDSNKKWVQIGILTIRTESIDAIKIDVE